MLMMNLVTKPILFLACFAAAVCQGSQPAPTNKRGFLARFRRAKEPPPQPPRAYKRLANEAFEKASALRDEATKAVESRRVKVEKEVNRRTKEVNKLAKEKGTEYKDSALREAKSRLKEVEKEAARLAQEAENLAKERAGAAENAARAKLAELEVFATNEAQRLADKAGRLTKQKTAEAEMSSKAKLAKLEESATEKVTEFLDSLIYGKSPTTSTPQPQKLLILPKQVADVTMVALRVLVFLSAIGNIWGPVQIVELWEDVIPKTGKSFADAFFPFEMSLSKKRTLAGCLEFCGFLLLGKPPESKLNLCGGALIVLMFTRGAIINSARNDVWCSVVPGIIATLAALYVANEVVVTVRTPDFENGGKKTA